MVFVWILYCLCGDLEIHDMELANLICVHEPAIISSAAENQYTYDRELLLQIGDAVKHRKYYKIVPIGVVKIIRSWNIQRRRKRGKRGGYQQRQRKMMSEFERIRTSNHNNLISVNTTKDRHIKNNSQNITIGLVNTRSVKNKDIWLKQELIEEGIDIVVVTETWLNDSNEQWIECTELNKDGFKMQNSFRKEGRKGEESPSCTKTSIT